LRGPHPARPPPTTDPLVAPTPGRGSRGLVTGDPSRRPTQKSHRTATPHTPPANRPYRRPLTPQSGQPGGHHEQPVHHTAHPDPNSPVGPQEIRPARPRPGPVHRHGHRKQRRKHDDR